MTRSKPEMLIELFGGGDGCCKGKGGSMHVGNMDKGMVPRQVRCPLASCGNTHQRWMTRSD